MPLCNEVARDDWIQGRDVILSDGQVWSIPLPRVQYTLNIGGPFNPERTIPTAETNRHFGKRFWDAHTALLDRLAAISEEGPITNLQAIEASLPLVCDLIRRNYDVTDADLNRMLVYIDGDEKCLAMFNELFEIVVGIGKKA